MRLTDGKYSAAAHDKSVVLEIKAGKIPFDFQGIELLTCAIDTYPSETVLDCGTRSIRFSAFRESGLPPLRPTHD